VYKLRQYQHEAVDAVLAERDQFQKLLMPMPTRAGKTVVFSFIAHRIWQARKEKTLVIAHRESSRIAGSILSASSKEVPKT
jgi:superfamily II DNA or RNA helicase